MVEITIITGAVLAIIGTVAFGIWLLKESRDSDRDFETLRRFRVADAQMRWAQMERKHRREIRETAEQMEKEIGLEAAESYYDSMMSIFGGDEEDPLEKLKRKHSDRLALEDNQDEVINSLPIWISQGGKMPRNP